MTAGPLRLAVLTDFPEEDWPSMDLCAEMLLQRLGEASAGQLVAERVCPAFRRRFTHVPILKRRGAARNADRLLNRFRVYPRYLRRRAADFDFFHICDHSYAHLVHALPAERTGVYCHDLDAFRCLLEPRLDPRPRWFRALMRRVLTGFQKAAAVFCTSAAIRDEVIQHGLIDPARLVLAPNGIADEFKPADHSAITEAEPYLLHVGSTIPRKRIDVLLDVFAEVRVGSGLQLLQIGGEWTPAQREQIAKRNLASSVRQLRGLTREELASYYRGATLVLQPSSGEGFGLPVVEALACGAPVLASDLPVLRETGGLAAVYAPMGDVAAWAQSVRQILDDPSVLPQRALRLNWAARFTWTAQAKTIADGYLHLAAARLPEKTL